MFLNDTTLKDSQNVMMTIDLSKQEVLIGDQKKVGWGIVCKKKYKCSKKEIYEDEMFYEYSAYIG